MVSRLLRLLRDERGYIDLSVGSYVAQIAIAFILGGFTTVVVFWKRIIGWFKRDKDS